MACCGRKPRPPTANRLPPLRIAPKASQAGGETAAVAVTTALCERVSAESNDLVIGFLRGALVVAEGKNKFELFSALRAQGCDGVEWYEPLQRRWNKLTPARREGVVKLLGKTEFTVGELLAATV